VVDNPVPLPLMVVWGLVLLLTLTLLTLSLADYQLQRIESTRQEQQVWDLLSPISRKL